MVSCLSISIISNLHILYILILLYCIESIFVCGCNELGHYCDGGEEDQHGDEQHNDQVLIIYISDIKGL